MKCKAILVLSFILFISCQYKSNEVIEKSEFEVGIVSDCQYCNCDSNNLRHYKESPNRLATAVDTMNQKQLSYTIHLGDFIDRDFSSFDTVAPIWNSLTSKSYHVLGNHDFQVADSLKGKVFEKMNLNEDRRYYSFITENWRFIVLDGNDLSFHGSLTEPKKKEADTLFRRLVKDSLPYAKTWNGGLSKAQLHWVKKELELAMEKSQNVGFYCHFPIFPLAGDNLWNRDDFIKLIDEYDCVKLFFNGHNHKGAYDLVDGIHFLTFKAMVNTNDETSFATVKFKNDSVLVTGYGRELNRALVID